MSQPHDDLLRSTFGADDVPPADESRDLLVQAQRGDPQAVNDLLHRYQGRIRRIIRIELGPRLRALMESVDIVQETLHDAARELVRDPGLEHENLLRWLSRIAVNRIRDAHDYHFAQRRDRDLETPIEPGGKSSVAPLHPVSPHTRADERAYRNEVREILDDAVADLPEDYQRVVVMRDYCGQDWESITRELGRANAHATRQLHQRAWIRIRQKVWPRLRGSS